MWLVLRYLLTAGVYTVRGDKAGGPPGRDQGRDLVTISVPLGSPTALAGAVLASQRLTGSGTAGTTSGLESITAVILGGASLSGGVGGVPGTVISILILGTLANGMAIVSVPSFSRALATGMGACVLAVGISQFRSAPRAAS